MSKIFEILKERHFGNKPIILHRNFQVKFKDLFKAEKIDLNKPLIFKNNIYDVVMCVGTFTYGHVKPHALDEIIRITKNKGLICFTINEGIYEEYGSDKKIKELTNNKLWNVKEFFKSNYITTKDVEAWLCLAEIIK